MDETSGTLTSSEFVDCLNSKVGVDKNQAEIEHKPDRSISVDEDYNTTLPVEFYPEDLLRCESINGKRRICKLKSMSSRNIVLLRQTGAALCRKGKSWGTTISGIWVDRGCRGIFFIGQPERHSTINANRPHKKQNRKLNNLPLPTKTKDGWVLCAYAGQLCKVPYPTVVRFGRPDAYYERLVQDEIACKKTRFGDPASHQKKACYFRPMIQQPVVANKPTARWEPPVLKQQAGPLRRARFACENRLKAQISEYNPQRVDLSLGLGSFENASLNKQPALELNANTLSGRGVIAENGNYVPLTFICRLNRTHKSALTTSYSLATKELIAADMLQNREKFQHPSERAGLSLSQKQWYISKRQQSWLVHGQPETDDRDFIASCQPGSAKATITFQSTVPTLDTGDSVRLSIAMGDYIEDYIAIGGSRNNEFGVSLPKLELGISDPLWQKLISQSTLQINIGGHQIYNVNLKGSANPVRQFVASCL
ncbi:DUF3011 domain-containing protein [Polycladidibacter stylochi]|uniref:DUF3011 domain-containing protein n=1 Tax=Polycladidibacter stylochi TaxID=1807766 RepID=UPI00138F4202|nr:DUF3011 domain-containing protein [Pseudovibrio stylochi]